MTNKIESQENENEDVHMIPFRLVFHIGAGKTGTSSIQKTLLANHQELIQQGVGYLGLMLERSPVKKFPWQRAGGYRQYISLSAPEKSRQVLEALRAAIDELRKAGCHEAIWSNELFWGQGPGEIRGALNQLISEGVDVRVVAYVRRHDAWVRSAYTQWALKHKKNNGPILSFNEWYKPEKINFYKKIKLWMDAFEGRVIIRNLDGVDDVVTDFMMVSEIDPENIEISHSNMSPSSEELFLHALFNNEYESEVPASKFAQVMNSNLVNYNQLAEDWLASKMPSDDDLLHVMESCVEDRDALNRLLDLSEQPHIDTTRLQTKPISIDSDKLLTAVSQLVVKQAVKLHKLEKNMTSRNSDALQVQNTSSASASAIVTEGDVGNDSAVSDAPVFAISTGRSGSTLVQRVLNCHKDLVVWGEHYGFLNGLASIYVQMSKPEQTIYPRKPEDNKGISQVLPTLQDPAAPLEWVNPWSFQEFKPQIKQFIEGYFAGRLEAGQRWGFKEIRYNNLPSLRMLKELYPKGRFVFIKRDALDVTRSKVFAFIKESKWSNYSDAEKESRIASMLNDVSEHYRIYDLFMKRNPGLGLVVDYEELVANPREVTAQMLSHCNLDPARFDWDLGDQVMGSIITKTKRDDEVIELIRSVADKIEMGNL